MYSGSDACNILSLRVIFEAVMGGSVQGTVVIVVTPCRLIEIYHPIFF